jgi:DNA-binding transcriptional regulator YhcF (GntR family)
VQVETKTIPRYEQIALDIIEDIRSGKIEPGQAIPSVRELMVHGHTGKRITKERMALFTAQRVQKVIKDSGLVAAPVPNEGKQVSGRRIVVLPPEEWPETV